MTGRRTYTDDEVWFILNRRRRGDTPMKVFLEFKEAFPQRKHLPNAIGLNGINYVYTNYKDNEVWSPERFEEYRARVQARLSSPTRPAREETRNWSSAAATSNRINQKSPNVVQISRNKSCARNYSNSDTTNVAGGSMFTSFTNPEGVKPSLQSSFQKANSQDSSQYSTRPHLYSDSGSTSTLRISQLDQPSKVLKVQKNRPRPTSVHRSNAKFTGFRKKQPVDVGDEQIQRPLTQQELHRSPSMSASAGAQEAPPVLLVSFEGYKMMKHKLHNSDGIGSKDSVLYRIYDPNDMEILYINDVPKWVLDGMASQRLSLGNKLQIQQPRTNVGESQTRNSNCLDNGDYMWSQRPQLTSSSYNGSQSGGACNSVTSMVNVQGKSSTSMQADFTGGGFREAGSLGPQVGGVSYSMPPQDNLHRASSMNMHGGGLNVGGNNQLDNNGFASNNTYQRQTQVQSTQQHRDQPSAYWANRHISAQTYSRRSHHFDHPPRVAPPSLPDFTNGYQPTLVPPHLQPGSNQDVSSPLEAVLMGPPPSQASRTSATASQQFQTTRQGNEGYSNFSDEWEYHSENPMTMSSYQRGTINDDSFPHPGPLQGFNLSGNSPFMGAAQPQLQQSVATSQITSSPLLNNSGVPMASFQQAMPAAASITLNDSAPENSYTAFNQGSFTGSMSNGNDDITNIFGENYQPSFSLDMDEDFLNALDFELGSNFMHPATTTTSNYASGDQVVDSVQLFDGGPSTINLQSALDYIDTNTQNSTTVQAAMEFGSASNASDFTCNGQTFLPGSSPTNTQVPTTQIPPTQLYTGITANSGTAEPQTFVSSAMNEQSSNKQYTAAPMELNQRTSIPVSPPQAASLELRDGVINIVNSTFIQPFYLPAVGNGWRVASTTFAVPQAGPTAGNIVLVNEGLSTRVNIVGSLFRQGIFFDTTTATTKKRSAETQEEAASLSKRRDTSGAKSTTEIDKVSPGYAATPLMLELAPVSSVAPTAAPFGDVPLRGPMPESVAPAPTTTAEPMPIVVAAAAYVERDDLNMQVSKEPLNRSPSLSSIFGRDPDREELGTEDWAREAEEERVMMLMKNMD